MRYTVNFVLYAILDLCNVGNNTIWIAFTILTLANIAYQIFVLSQRKKNKERIRPYIVQIVGCCIILALIVNKLI